ncbi:MAG: glycosyltransferase [Planctomycetota bacterium]
MSTKPRAFTVGVVTPSYQQGEFLAECLASVRSQRHRAMEHFVFDPGSTDGSREIAAAAEGVTLVAEPDEGQADAVGTGMRRVQADIIAWLNSDDAYSDDTVFKDVLARFNAPDAPDVVYGKGIYVDAAGVKTRDAYVNSDPTSLGERLAHEVGILQPAVFIRRSVVEQIGVPDAELNFAMDYEFWIRSVRAGHRWVYLDRELARARYYEDNKTLGKRGESYAEIADVSSGHFGFLDVRWARRWAEHEVAGLDGILKNSGNTETDGRAVEKEAATILRAYNSGYAARRGLTENSRSARLTRQAMIDAEAPIEQICKPVDADAASGNGFRCYTVGSQRWAFSSAWHAKQTARSRDAFVRLASQRAADTAVIVGNGPSLNQTDLSLLDGADVFVSNYAHLKPELFSRATYLCVVNNLVAEQGAAAFGLIRGVTKVFPYWLGYCIAEGDNTLFVDSIGYPEFSTDIAANISWRHTVSFFHMQLAYGLGYTRVALVGFDHSYRQSVELAEGDVVEQTAADANHFDPRYFKGKKWHAADVDNMEAMYRLAKEAFEDDGRTIVNSTAGGHLELFDRADLAEFLSASHTH